MLGAVYDVVIHYDSFRNVDLFHQGLYHIKSRVYYLDGDNNKRYLTPIAHYTAQSLLDPLPNHKSRTAARADHHCLLPPHIIDEKFATRSFLIRYCEEEVEMNDIVQFRAELDPEDLDNSNKNNNSVPNMQLEIDLMFADLSQQGGAERFGEAPEAAATEFKSVSTQSFLIYGLEDGIHCFCPAVFDEYHFSLANIIVHTALTDFRFRLSSKPLAGQNGPVSVCSALFADVPEFSRIKRYEKLKDMYSKRLRNAKQKIDKWYDYVCKKCLTEEQKQLFLFEPGIIPRETQAQADLSGEVANGLEQKSAVALSGMLLREINEASANTFESWQRLLNLIPYCNREVTSLLRVEWEENMIKRWGESVFTESMLPEDVYTGDDKNIEVHAQLAEKCRIDSDWRKGMMEPPLPVEDEAMTPKIDIHPIVFERTYRAETRSPYPVPVFSKHAPLKTQIPSAPKAYRGSHLFILVHGFQGNSFDMRLMKNNVAVLYPDAIFLCSNSNEENTEGDIHDMGIRLAQEVVNYICDWCPGPTLGRLSFIAHSIGGLIVRAALPLLQEYSSKLYSFISFSTAHLGYMYNASTLVNTGIWVLKKWRKSKCLAQLSMTDAEDPNEAFLYILSQEPGLEWFTNVVLISSAQDQYAPFDSARIEMSQQAQADPLADVYRTMVSNLWKNVKPEALTRFNVDFKIPERNLDAIIGRAAHIQFLESQPVMRMIIHTYPAFFR